MRRAPEGPEGTGGLRGAAPNEVRPPSLAGGRALRRPEHPWGHKQQHAARTAAGPGCVARGRRRGLAGLLPTRRAAEQRPGPTGVEGAGGICRGAGGRLRGLAASPVGGGGAWPGFETTRRAKLAARPTRGRAAAHGRTKQPGPRDRPRGARNTSGTTSTNTAQGARARRPAPPDATTQTRTIRSTCVRSRSAHAARQSRRSSRSLRLRRRAGRRH